MQTIGNSAQGPGQVRLMLLQGKDGEALLELMEAAIELDMPRALACCERHIAVATDKKLGDNDFWQRVPACSTLHMMQGMARCYGKLQKDIKDNPNKYTGYSVASQCPCLMLQTVSQPAKSCLTWHSSLMASSKQVLWWWRYLK